MADDVQLSAGTADGAVFATDDDGTRHWPYMKIAFGPNNTQNIVGSISSNPLPVALSTTDNAVLDAIVTQLTAGAATPVKAEDVANAGGDSGVPSMAVRKATPIDLSGADGDYEFLQMDNGRLWTSTTIDAALPAGTNAIGKLAANSGVDIGDIDILSVLPGTGAANLGKAEDAGHSSGDVGVMALAVREDAPVGLAADGLYHPLTVSDKGGLWTEGTPNVVDSGNSTTSTLAGAAVFTGTGVDMLRCEVVSVLMNASHDSATDGLQFQFSSDDSNWDVTETFEYTASEGGRRFTLAAHGQYFRVVYTNGGTNQTHFRLQTILHQHSTVQPTHRIGDDTHPDRSANLVKAAIIAQAAGSGDFVLIQATAAGNLKFSLEEISDGLDIGAGNAGSETQRVSISTDDVNLSAIKSAVEIMDDWDETNRAAVNLISGQAGIAGGTGSDGATVPRVTLATDVSLPAGTETIGKLAANSGVDIGDVDVTSVPRSISGPAEPGTAVDSYDKVSLNLTTGADQVLVASAADKQIWVYGYMFTCGDADGQTVSFQDQDDVALSGIMEFIRYGGAAVSPSGNFSMPIWKLGTDKDLEVDITGGDVDGWLSYAILSV